MESAAQKGAITIIWMITNNYLKRNSALIEQLQQTAPTPESPPPCSSSLDPTFPAFHSHFDFFNHVPSLTQTSLPFLHLLSADRSRFPSADAPAPQATPLFIYVEGHAEVSASPTTHTHTSWSGRLTIPSASLLIYHPNGRYK